MIDHDSSSIPLGKIVRSHAAKLAPQYRMPICDAESHASMAVWEAVDVPAQVAEWIESEIRRCFRREHQRQRRHAKRNPNYEDLFPGNGISDSKSFDPADRNGDPPEVEAAVRELNAQLDLLPKDALEARAMDSMLGRTSASLTKKQLVFEATASPGSSYRRLAKLDRRIEDEVKRHLSTS